MSRKPSNPNINDKPTVSPKHSNDTRVPGNKKKVAGICCFRLPKTPGFSPVKFVWRLSAKLAKALSVVSMRRKRKKPSPKVSSSDLGRSKSRSRSVAPPVDSHQSEAIQDCIQFINSSSSLQRSGSVPASS